MHSQARHRTAVVDRKLYVDGGFIDWAPVDADPANQTSAGATASDKALGYYYGGWPTSTLQSEDSTTKALSTMVVYNMLENKFSTQPGPDQIGRAEGVMLYVPAGDAGVLVYFGGVQVINGTHQPLPMSDVFVYDIANGRWYKQTTSGAALPGSRRRACAGVVWAEDRSSYNIYLYGGASVGEGIGYGDVWVLSLPSFTWIKFSSTADDIAVTSPRHSLTCDVYENSQMVIMGGNFTNSTDCDAPWVHGQHSLYLGRANVDGSKWAAFNASLTAYNVPREVTDVIGGDSAGHATVTAPKNGSESGDVSAVFERKHTPVPRSPTRPITTPASDSSSPNKRSILGPAIGGTLGGVLLIAAIGYYLLFIHGRQQHEHPPPPPEPHYHISQPSPHIELPGALARSYSTTSFPPHDHTSPQYTPHHPHTPYSAIQSPAQASWTSTARHATHTLHAWGLSELGDEKEQRLLVPAHELSGVRSPRESPRHSRFKEEDFAGT
ncbi:hypothetical protein N0V95_000849 [Ascochyta clinopodiicola]|nr:hypothetical protein N0V95_000849 [Ascochyta clinopodiicola]